MAPAMMQSPAAAPIHGLAATASDSTVVKQIGKTHFPNGEEIDAMSILHIAKDILDECKNNISPTQISEEEGGDNTKLTPELQFEVNRLSIQLSHRSLDEGDDVHKKSITLLNMLSSYSWEVKVALILAAYVSNYGEYWLLAQTYRDQDPVAINMVALLQMSDLLKDDNNKLETLFKPLENLVNSILDLCRCIVEVKEFLSSGYASSNPGEFAKFRAIIIISSYWIIRCCVICTSYMHSLILKDPSRTTSMDEVVRTLAAKIEPLHNHLQKQLLICYQKLDAKDKIEELGRVLNTNHIDNMNVLKLLFDAMDDKPTPIFDVSNKKHVSLGTFKNKTVLLLISITDLELPFLQEWYEKCNQVQRSQHDIIFIPITEIPVDTKNKTLTMPFYIVDDPIDPTVIRFVKEKLNFQEEPILVALGTEGRLVHPNAMPMVWTWGAKAFPLTTENEESLRESEKWKLEMLINDLDDNLIKMAQEGQSICLYGGDNLEWIRRFAAKAKEVANSFSVPLEMFFLGKNTDNLTKLKKTMSIIYSEKLVSTIPELDSTKVRSLWAHLERMLLSRAQYLKRTKKNSVNEDQVLQGLEKLLDRSGCRGWALFSKGNDIALIGDEYVTMKALNDIDKWKGNVTQNGFEGALKDYYETLQGGQSDRPCCRLHFQDGRSDEILESITCPECHRRLIKYTTFLCNHHVNGGDKKKLVFFEGGGGYSFELEDLLRASAEVLGKGSVGTSYKARLEEGTTVVVKRLRDVAVSREEFEKQMEVLGKLKNENVFPLRAFYFSEGGERILVSDYMHAGSLSTLLHRGSPIDWDTRMGIALCAAKGLEYLHERGKIVHGNIKASNILLKQDNHQYEACLSDYGLNPLFSNSTPLNHGYCAPEVLETGKVTFESDVYSFGVLLLELLTRKSPKQASLGDEGIDLPRWVQSVVREEWTSKVFDVELMGNHNVEEEDLVQVLQIGVSCVAAVPNQRPTMADVVRMIEDVYLLI